MTISEKVKLPGNNPISLGAFAAAVSFFILSLVLGIFRALRLIMFSIVGLPLCWRGVEMKVRLESGCFLLDSVMAITAAVAAVVMVEALVKKQWHEERGVKMVRGK